MKKILGSYSLLLLSFVAAPVRAEFDVIAGWERQLFPSYIIGTSSVKNDAPEDLTRLGEPDGLLGIEIQAQEDDVPIELTIECDGFLEPSSLSGTLRSQGTKYCIYPKVKYKFDRLSQCTQATPATVNYRVAVREHTILEKPVTVTFRSINDCPLSFKNGEKLINTSLIFASYVNEQHSFIDKMLRESLDIGVVDKFVGYQGDSAEEVLRQVYPLWDLLVERDVRYSNVTTTAADASEVGSQHVRLLEETINNQQANCVDGSVLLVSMLRKIGIESYLVLVPGHCYVGFFLDEKHTKAVGLETTLVGAEMKIESAVGKNLENAVAEELRGEQSWASFVNSLDMGIKALESNLAAFFNPEECQYRIIDIAQARKIGILPIPHRGQEAFCSFDHSASVDEESNESSDEEQEDDDQGEENE